MAIAVGILITLTFPSEAGAASFTVTEGGDYPLDTSPGVTSLGACECKSTATGHPCTLRAAIQASNACASSSDTITVSSSVSILRLTIDGAVEDSAASGDLDIVRHPTYGASGAKTVVINLGNYTLNNWFTTEQDRFFDIPATEDDLTVYISAGHLYEGEAPDPSSTVSGDEERGGCLRALAGTVILSTLHFDSCKAYYQGGAIYANDIHLEIYNADIGYNGLPVPSPAPVIYSPEGGALYAYNSTVEIYTSDFFANGLNGSDEGGAIYVEASYDSEYEYGGNSIIIDSTTIAANGTKSRGGGAVIRAPFLIEETEVIDNYAVDGVAEGAGLYIEVPNYSQALQYIASSYIEGNYDASDGGGIWAGSGTAFGMFDTEVTLNEAENGGGVFLNNAELFTTSSILRLNRAELGGGIHLVEG
ncbi:MAG: hypothetical protein R3B72_36250 [Polyangiaceae bacterium]